MYRWPLKLPQVHEDGTVSNVSWRSLTYADLQLANALGLGDGDVSRIYICGTIPQGMPGAEIVTDALRFSKEAIDAARAALPEAEHAVDDAVRVAFVAGLIRSAKRRFGRHRAKHARSR
jgi:hypothetical protein